MTSPSTINHQPSTSLLLIGCGNMGSALATRWMRSLATEFSPIKIVEPNANPNIPHVKHLEQLSDNLPPHIIVLAVKPQQLDEVLPHIAQKFGTPPLYLSIAAGKPIAFYEKHLGQGAKVVRAMPNTPAMVGQGMTVMCHNEAVSPEARTQAERLMGAVGDTLWLEESFMDAVTAISGSGPAYIYYIMECLVAAGVKQGLPEKEARLLALTTCKGAAGLALESESSLAELRKQVTSPGGTTEAALKILQKDNVLSKLIDETVSAAVKRAKEL